MNIGGTQGDVVTETFDPLRILAALRAHGVSFVVMGGMASVVQGSSIETDDLDICIPSDHENLQRLVLAIQDLKGDPARPSAVGEHRVSFATRAGRLDCVELTSDFEALWARADEADFGRGIVAKVASIEDLFDAKRASGDLSGAAAVAALIPTIEIEHEEEVDADEEEAPHGVHKVLKVLEGVDTWLTDLTNGNLHRDRTRS
jgi:hypothetical protein